MSTTVSDFLLQRLREWGITRIYGYPGDGINGILGALNRAGDDFDFIQVRHEEMAAFMASGHAKFTGQVGVCLATSGPGAIHLLNGLYDAKLDHQPVVAIVGQQARAALGGSYQQEVDLVSLFKDVASEYVEMVVTPQQMRHVVDRAVRIARAQRAPTCIIVPNDLQEMPAQEPARRHGTVHSGIGYAIARPIPDAHELQRAADALNAGKKVAMLVGAGALHATAEVLEVADMLGAGIAKALLGKAAVPDTLPFVTGSIGLLGTRPSYRMMMECDTLLMVGSAFPYSEFLPPEDAARGVQIDIDARMLSIRYPMDVNLVGDSASTLRLLRPLLKRKQDRGWREKIEKDVADWWKTLEARAMTDAHPINPQRDHSPHVGRLVDGPGAQLHPLGVHPGHERIVHKFVRDVDGFEIDIRHHKQLARRFDQQGALDLWCDPPRVRQVHSVERLDDEWPMQRAHRLDRPRDQLRVIRWLHFDQEARGDANQLIAIRQQHRHESPAGPTVSVAQPQVRQL
jgi:pyruvate dehydrogenase (quinone)